MMTHLEGPIVDSLYDMALLTWHDELKPPLPLVGSPQSKETGTFDSSFLDLATKSQTARTDSVIHTKEGPQPVPEHVAGDPHYDDDLASELVRMQAALTPVNGESAMELVTKHLSTCPRQTFLQMS